MLFSEAWDSADLFGFAGVSDGLILNGRGNSMFSIIFGGLLLVWPLMAIPALVENKKRQGIYFSEDKRILVAKASNFGNNLNMKNKFGFSLNVLIGLALII